MHAHASVTQRKNSLITGPYWATQFPYKVIIQCYTNVVPYFVFPFVSAVVGPPFHRYGHFFNRSKSATRVTASCLRERTRAKIIRLLS